MAYNINSENKEALKLIESAIKAFDNQDFATVSSSLELLLEYNKSHKILSAEYKLLVKQALGIALIGQERYDKGLFYIEYAYNKLIAIKEIEDNVSMRSLHILGEAYFLEL